MEDTYFVPADAEHVAREKNKAKELRRSQWWKRKRATGQCHYCQQSFPPHELTMDHVVPLIRGGRTTKSNVGPCCKHCNSQKQHLLPVEWAAYLERLQQRKLVILHNVGYSRSYFLGHFPLALAD